MHVSVFFVLTAVTACSSLQAGSFAPVSPSDGGRLTTPLTAVLRWSACPGAGSYRVKIWQEGVRGPVVDAAGLPETEYRAVLCPSTKYRWSVWGVDASGRETQAEKVPASFVTAGTEPKEVTDPAVIFAGWRPEAKHVNTDPLEIDPGAPISPWFWKKKYDQVPPPTFEQAKDRLPRPVWDGHQDAIDMYWYAWSVLFKVWLYPPGGEGHFAVSNNLGFPTWAGWGSTMVWDSAFILQFARYGHWAYPTITGIDNCYARQHENGFICRESENRNIEVNSGWPVNLPLLAWTEWANYELTADSDRIRQVFIPLVKQYEWYMLYQRRANGLYWGNRSAEGMDDSPSGMLMHASVGAVSTMAQSADVLSAMAAVVGRHDLRKWFAQEYARLREMINTSYWDEEHRLYNDLTQDGKHITRTAKGGVCKHGFVFWPMIAGAVDQHRLACLEQHLLDEKSFAVRSGIASLSRDSDYFVPDTGAYWRGSVWPPVNYMVVAGLRRCGKEDLAYRIARRYYDSFLAAYKTKKDITEFLAPDRPTMYGCETFVGWGGCAPIAILFEDIMGIRVDAPANTIAWRIRQPERHGVEGLRFGDRIVSLMCDATNDGGRQIEVVSDGGFTLVVHGPRGVVRKAITKGRTEFQL